MKKIIFVCLFCSVFVNITAQYYDTIYFYLTRIRVQDKSFIATIEKFLKDSTTCSGYSKHDIFALDFDTTNSKFDITLTMLPCLNPSSSKSNGYFYIGQRLFIVHGNIPPKFAYTTKHKKRFYYLVQKPDKYGLFRATPIEEFCVMLLHYEDNIWKFIEERQNY